MRDKNVLRLILTVCLCILMTGMLSAQSHAQVLKIADVSMTDISNKSERIKSALEALKKSQSQPTQKMTTLSSEIRQLQESLEKGKSNLKEQEKTKIEDQMRSKYQELQQEQQEFRSKLVEQQKTINDSIMAQINQAVAKVAEKEGISLVFLKESIIYSKDIPDITDKVMVYLDASKQAPAKK
ncbi:MAG: OmpH family outer membrane protein [Desulfomonilaceae bacterium]